MEARGLKKKKAKGGHMQHGHTQWRVPTAPVAAKPAKKPKEEPKPAVGASSLCALHPALSNPSVPAVQGAPLGKRPAARADSEPLKKQKKKVPKTNRAPAKSESSRPATGYTAAPIAPAAPAAQYPLATTAATTAAATAAAHAATSAPSAISAASSPAAATAISASSSTKGPPVAGGSSAATGGMAPFSRSPIGQVAPAAEPSHLLLLLGLPPGATADDVCQHFRSCAPLQVQSVGADSGL
jgi:hypothetical protein